LPGQSRMPVPVPVPGTDADAAAVIAEAEDAVRAVLGREIRRVRRAGRKARAARRVLAGRARRAERAADRLRTREQRRLARAERTRQELAAHVRRLREASGGSILECFRTVADPRDPRGVRYALASVLALVTAAMLAGCETLADIIAWISHAPREELEALGCRAAPCGRTVTRILALVSPPALSRAVGAWLARAEEKGPVTFPVAGPALLPQVTCDGKEVRGALRPDGSNLFLLSAALTGTARRAASGAIVLADREIPAKTNEIPEIGPMLLELAAWFPLAGHVITADALHTQREFTETVCGKLLAHYVLTVKRNQKNLYRALEALCWAGASRHVTRDKGHGRAERRSHLVMDAPAEIRALFSHVRQIAKVVRTRTVTSRPSDGSRRARVTKTSTETVYLITSLTSREAAPGHIAAYIRAHWGIENQVHWVRDTTLREDSSKVSAGNRPANMATLRNAQLGVIRQHGSNDIAATRRQARYDNDLLHALLRLEPAT
jgi:predicted transposase YbfD/YdcC